MNTIRPKIWGVDMKVFDLHCDTASRILEKQERLAMNSGQLDLAGGKAFSEWVQTFAFFADDALHGEEAWQNLQAQYEYLCAELAENHVPLYDGTVKPVSALLAVEGAGMLGGTLSRMEWLAEHGIQMLTITWNHANEWASGIQDVGGFTSFGRQGVRELERHHILADVSHLNQESFWDLTRLTHMPLVATHSNAKAVCAHPRNLDDDQIRAILMSGGIIGVNFFPLFVNGKEDCSFSEIAKHAEHFLNLGAEKQLCLGSDFDGAPMPSELNFVKQLEKFYVFMVNYFGKECTERLFFENAASFFKEWAEEKGRKNHVL